MDLGQTEISLCYRSEHPLAQLYCHSTMEHHHFDQCLMILNGPVSTWHTFPKPNTQPSFESMFAGFELFVMWECSTVFVNSVSSGPTSADEESLLTLTSLLSNTRGFQSYIPQTLMCVGDPHPKVIYLFWTRNSNTENLSLIVWCVFNNFFIFRFQNNKMFLFKCIYS